MDSSNAENEEIRVLDAETPRAAPRDIVPASESDSDLVRKLLAEVSKIREENQQMKKELENIKTKEKGKSKRSRDNDPECSNAVRNVYKELKKQQEQEEDGENRPAFDFSVSFHSSSNQAMAKKILTEQRNLLSAVHQHWRSLRDDGTRKTKNSFEKHRKQVKRSNRLKRKLSRRLSCLEKTTVLSKEDKKKAREILSSPDAMSFMSSEESCEEDAVERRSGPKPRKIRSLSWEKSKLRNIKAKLDEAHFAGLSERQRRTSARVTRSEEESARPQPSKGPSWAVRRE
ncbi:hypothetical protein ACROYT_G006529 [Oculina patagonica]